MDKPRKGLNVGTFQCYEFEEGSKGPYGVMNFSIGGKDFRVFLNPWATSFRKYGKEVTDPKEVEEYNRDYKKMIAEPAMAIVGEAKVKEALKGINGFKDFMLTLMGLVPANKVKLDLFLQYQPKIREGQERTWLELPRNVDQGVWCTKHTQEYRQQINQPYDAKTADALTYLAEDGEIHPFKRSGWFLLSNYWNPQGVAVRETKKEEEPAVGFDDNLPF